MWSLLVMGKTENNIKSWNLTLIIVNIEYVTALFILLTDKNLFVIGITLNNWILAATVQF